MLVIGHSNFLWKKIIAEIDLVIKNYESAGFKKLLHSKKTKKKYEWYEHDLMTYIDNLKYDHFINNMDSHFSNAKVTNFDIIHYQCRGDELENPQQYYKTIFDKVIVNYENHVCSQAILSAIKAEHDDIHFKRDFLKFHIKRDIEKDLISNGIFVKKNRKKTTDDCKKKN